MPSISEKIDAFLVGKSEKLARKVLPQRFLEATDNKLIPTNIALSGSEYCGLSFLFGGTVAVAVLSLSPFFSFPIFPDPVFALVSFVVLFLILTMILPVFLIRRRVGELENALPDGLRQMSTALKTGMSIDAAIDDVAKSEFGPLSEEFERTLAQVRRGRSVQGALRAMAERTRSELYERAFFLTVEGMEKGAELASVLEAVADDIRNVHTIQRERRAATMQQVLFLLVAALFAAPFIAGLVISIGALFSNVGVGGGVGGWVEEVKFFLKS